MHHAGTVQVLRSGLDGEPCVSVTLLEQAIAEQVVIGRGQRVGRDVTHGADLGRRHGAVNHAICRFCKASSSSWKVGMCSVGAILRPVSTET